MELEIDARMTGSTWSSASRFSVDSRDNIHANGQNYRLFALYSGQDAFDSNAGRALDPNSALSQHFITDILWDSDLSNDQIDGKVLSGALQSTVDITEGMWILDDFRGLSFLNNEKVATIIP